MIKKYKQRKAQQARNLELVDIFTPDGWKALTIECNRILTKIDPDYEIDQIKEKFGTLRYYYSTDIREKDEDRQIMMFAIARHYEDRSKYMCEACGKYGTLRKEPKYWMRTLCDTHAIEYGYLAVEDNG